MAERPYTKADLEILARWDTPTICNGLELTNPERRAIGFTTAPLVPIDPGMGPIVGLARTGTIRSKEPSRGKVADRGDWYEYVAATDLPTIVVIQDVDDQPGYGAFWGEVQSTVHRALGVLGCVTNGSYRDIDAWAPGFHILGAQVGPSHAHVHTIDFGRPVNVAGMAAVHDDVIHADRHGAVLIPADAVRRLPDAIDLLTRRERVILEMATSSDFTVAKLRDALRRAGEIH
jgi:regulator of RNase E activity RraA